MEQDATDKAMQKELDKIAKIMRNQTYNDYCKYETDVGDLVKTRCPICQYEIEHTGIGVSIVWTNIRNYIRHKAKIKFVGDN